MSNKKEALGKGIRALLENIDVDAENPGNKSSDEGQLLGIAVASLPLDQIEVNPFQPRADFDQVALEELANSIRIHGVIQPITVRSVGAKKFQLIAGERRLRAAKEAGLTEVPAYIRSANDQEMLEIGLIENIQREDLNAVEIAINYKRLMDECDLKQEELANRVGKERATVANYLRLLKLPPEIQLGIKEKQITMGHARAIISMDDMVAQLSVYKDIVNKGLSVRKVEELVRGFNKKESAPTKAKPKAAPIDPAYRKIENELQSHFGTKVSLKQKTKGAGEIVIPYYSDDDLNRILDMLDT